jgi:hypothetical protein
MLMETPAIKKSAIDNDRAASINYYQPLIGRLWDEEKIYEKRTFKNMCTVWFWESDV